jgi:DNA-binding CsgD family transcriptional regulator
VPTLVLHSNRDEIAPLSEGKFLASRIPGAVFVQLESRNHVLLEHEPAWREFQDAVLEFTGRVSATAATGSAPTTILTERERMMLERLCAGRSNAQIAWELGIAEKTARNHISNLYRKLGVRSRAEAIVLACRRPE